MWGTVSLQHSLRVSEVGHTAIPFEKQEQFQTLKTFIQGKKGGLAKEIEGYSQLEINGVSLLDNQSEYNLARYWELLLIEIEKNLKFDKAVNLNLNGFHSSFEAINSHSLLVAFNYKKTVVDKELFISCVLLQANLLFSTLNELQLGGDFIYHYQLDQIKRIQFQRAESRGG
ncbi:MAG: hypothetical protein FWF59_15350 [Turicibacter sp.]|nr:hypothetical protein [Turicibacter sp.]